MKKQTLILCGLLALLLSGCGRKTPAETLPVETTGSAEPVVEYVTAQIPGIPAVLKTLSRGDSVDVVDAFDDKHYVVKLDVGYGLVEKNLVRLETEPAFTSRIGYAYRNAKVYDNYRLAGQPARYLEADTPVEIRDDLGWCYLVNLDGTTGYMKPETLAGTPASNVEPQDGSVGEDGGEISMRFSGQITLLSTIAPQEGTVSGKATVLAEGTQIVLGYFDLGDQIPVVKTDAMDGKLTVYLDGLYAEIASDHVLEAGDSPYASWEATGTQILSLFRDRWMLGSPMDRLNPGTPVTVLYELEDCYLVEVNGVTGYVPKAAVVPTEEEIPEETTTETKAPEETTKPTSPTTPTKPKEETPKPTEPSTPSETTKPTEPSTPSETTKPTEPSTPPETTNPTEPSTPPETTKPTEPSTPPETTNPTEPSTPPETTKPTEPSTPPETTKPTEPSTPPETTAPPEWTPPIL